MCTQSFPEWQIKPFRAKQEFSLRKLLLCATRSFSAAFSYSISFGGSHSAYICMCQCSLSTHKYMGERARLHKESEEERAQRRWCPIFKHFPRHIFYFSVFFFFFFRFSSFVWFVSDWIRIRNSYARISHKPIHTIDHYMNGARALRKANSETESEKRMKRRKRV